ncbi:MAG: iron complex outermembrane receptor protein, partial [Marinoscillum sp.]
MNFINPKALLSLLMMMLFGYISYSQVSISGKVTDAESGDDLIGVSVLVKGTVLGTITDVNGEFNLKITQAPPVTLVISSVGYERQQIDIDQSTISNLAIELSESYMLGQEVVVSASRVEES